MRFINSKGQMRKLIISYMCISSVCYKAHALSKELDDCLILPYFTFHPSSVTFVLQQRGGNKLQ